MPPQQLGASPGRIRTSLIVGSHLDSVPNAALTLPGRSHWPGSARHFVQNGPPPPHPVGGTGLMRKAASATVARLLGRRRDARPSRCAAGRSERRPARRCPARERRRVRAKQTAHYTFQSLHAQAYWNCTLKQGPILESLEINRSSVRHLRRSTAPRFGFRARRRIPDRRRLRCVAMPPGRR